MEMSAILAFFLCELIAGIMVYVYWRRHRSELSLAEAQFASSAKDHYSRGSLERYMVDVARGKESIYTRKRSLLPYLWVFLAGILGFLVIYSIKHFTEIGVVLRTIIGILAILPFTSLLSIQFAIEADENGISAYEKNTAEQVLDKIKTGTIELHIKELG
jgi:peptidoglycan/LPS O-acetylase OafA/YrhL